MPRENVEPFLVRSATGDEVNDGPNASQVVSNELGVTLIAELLPTR